MNSRVVSAAVSFAIVVLGSMAASVTAQNNTSESSAPASPTASPEPAPSPSSSPYPSGSPYPVYPSDSPYPSGSYYPQCPPDMYWDAERQACMKPYSGDPNASNYPPPAPCPEGSYWDPGRNACAAPGDYNQSRPPQDAAMEECFRKMESVKAELESFWRAQEERTRQFQEEFAAARREFSMSEHSDEEWKAFMDSWMEKGRPQFEGQESEVQARMRELLGDCYDRLHMGEMAGGPRPMPSFHVPEFGPPPGGDDFHRGLPPPPMRDERFSKLDGEAEQIRQECEFKARALMKDQMPMAGEGRPRPMAGNGSTGDRPMDGSGPMMGPMGMDPELERQMREIWRECEERIRALFEQERQEHEGDEDVSDFKENFGSLDMYFDEELGRIIVRGKFLSLQGNPESQMMEDISCDGPKFVDRLFVNGLLADFRPEETGEGTALNIFDSGGRRILSLHDNPRCVINVAASDEIPSISLDLADYLEIEENEAGDLRFASGDGFHGIVLLHGADVDLQDGNLLEITGKATFLVRSDRDAGSKRLGSAYDDAIEDKNVGAEIKVVEEDGDLAFDATPLGDLEIEIEGGDSKVTATIDSEAGDGKTVSLEFDRAVFETDDLVVSVVAVDENGNESDVDVGEADDLDDILDPLDDGADGIEYWIVEDKNGFHVLVSFSHFSEKRVTIESVNPPAAGNGLIPGFEPVLLAAALGFAAVVVGVRRRRGP